MTQDDVLAIVRHALTSAGGAFVASGTITADQLQTASGAVVVLAGLAWSILNKRQHRAQLAAASAQPKV